ncbi:MAG TPA: class I SAM-dependent methyltransferase [Geminicoccaceae bacterium]|nr:class I SAM-dependent methyltransferase [Geminicoccaceae bacterium]
MARDGPRGEPPALARLYPEMAAGGWPRFAPRIEFYARVRSLLRPDMTVLDFGAGRGQWFADPVAFRRDLASLRGRCAEVVGADVDPAVRGNPTVDRAVVLTPGRPLPFPDASFDLIVAWAVFEHIEDPEGCAGELARVLKPGGWLCAWTPNARGYVGLGARLVPNRLHARLVRRISPYKREERDVFPTWYRMNTLGRLRRLFPEPAFQHVSYAANGVPGYFLNSYLLGAAMRFLFRFVPESLSAWLFVFVRRR